MKEPVLNRRQAVALSAAAAATGFAGLAHADDAPMRLEVSFPPGGSTDIASRIIQPRLSELAGRPVIVENRPGAASQIATQYVAKAAPDGNTLLVSFDTHAINPIAKAKLPYDTFKDFVGVSLAVRFPLVIGANAQHVQAKDLREFVKDARANPSKYSYASTGAGSMNQLVMEDIKRRANVFVLHVPFSGGGPAVQAVLGNVTSLTLLSYAALRGQITAGKIRPLAVTGSKRLPELPDVPTVAECGFPGFEAYSWIGIFAPAGTPAATVQRLTREFQGTLQTPDIHSKLTQAGFEVVGSDGPGVDKHLRQEYERWRKFVQDTNLKLEE